MNQTGMHAADATRLTHRIDSEKSRTGGTSPGCPVVDGTRRNGEAMKFVTEGERPEPDLVKDEATLRQAVAKLLASRRDVRAVAVDTGLSKTTVADLRRMRRRITLDALDKIIQKYAPDRRADWTAAWRRAYAADGGGRVGSPTKQRSLVPRELPPDVPAFVGRRDELVQMDRIAITGRTPILAVTGTAGVGKTALAVQWAHRNQHRFPDGCLYVDLHGYDRGDPLEPAAAQSAVLRSLGIESAGFPEDQDGRAARYRTLIADRRVLLLLDNAHDSDQIRPLLPGLPGSLVLVTSRDGLTELRDRFGARQLELGVLLPADAVELLTELAPADRRDGAGLRVLAERCARLPLALRIAAGALADRLGLTAASLADQLAADDTTLNATLQTVFASSYRYLESGAAQSFRLLGCYLGESVDLPGFTALSGVAPTEARFRAARLQRARLLHEVQPGRYSMHDLLRQYARDMGLAEDPPAAREAATDRLLEHYLDFSVAAATLLHPHWTPRRGRPTTAALRTPGEAMSWLKVERSNLVRYAALAATRDRPATACQLADALWNDLYRSGHHLQAVLVHDHAARAAKLLGSDREKADALQRLAIAQLHLGRYAEAECSAAIALSITRRLGDRVEEGKALGLLGTLFARRDRNAEALTYLRQHLAITRETGDRVRESQVLNNIGLVTLRWGRHREALDDLHAAIDAARQLGSVAGEAIGLNNLGLALQRLDRTDEALALLTTAAGMARDTGNRGLRGQVLDSLGVTRARRAELDEARQLLIKALDIHRENGELAAEAETLDNLGGVLRRQGRAAEALELHLTALRIALELDERGRAASAYNGAGLARNALGDSRAARHDHYHALHIAEAIGNLDEQARALTGLAAISSPDDAARLHARAADLYRRLGLSESATDQLTTRRE